MPEFRLACPQDSGAIVLPAGKRKTERDGIMKFVHMADVHLGCVPDGRAEWAQERKRELWETFRASVEDASLQKADLVLIAGDLFHHTPDEQQLREVNYLLGSYPEICFAVIAGNHDCCSPGSAWETFEFAQNIAFLGSRGLECIRFSSIGCEVYGFSYDRQQITQARYDRLHPEKNEYFHILLAHGGDRDHIPISAQALQESGFDYIALGHIHKPTVILPDFAVYPGALSPIDSGDEGPHGYLLGETYDRQVKVRFVKKALREYVSMTVMADEEDTVFSIRDKVEAAIDHRGPENLYTVTIGGQRDPAVQFDRDLIRAAGMILEVTDRSTPAFHLEELKRQYRGQLIGQYIESFEDHERTLTEEKALQYGLEALLAGMKETGQTGSGS